ncbi:DUF4145 domain-containing protein [Paenibacillus pabuli]|uniref:DUF4145 domain-containing protein n=1 Tax=Paenibacillus pabuli TaxID=1472 RepID=UPI003CF59845
MINDLHDFKRAIVQFSSGTGFISSGESSSNLKTVNVKVSSFPFREDIHCSKCSDIRKNEIEPLYLNDNFNETYFGQLKLRYKQLGKNDIDEYEESVNKLLSPSFWQSKCLQCNSKSHIVIHEGPQGQEFLILPSSFGGLSTPNTPKNVSFYLDQANRSHILGANSAAMAMYRAAIEHILVEQGYTRRMLGNKIQDLLMDVANEEAPSWAYEVDAEFLQYIKKLGDSAIHANDGEIEQQIHLDNELIKNVKTVISFLLFSIYEVSRKKQKLLDSLKTAMNKMEE